MPRLYQVPRKSKSLCGPSAIAAIVGTTPRDIERDVLRLRQSGKYRYRKGVEVGTYWGELVKVLIERGYVVNQLRLPRRRRRWDERLGRVVRSPRTVESVSRKIGYTHVHLVETTTHFLALRAGVVVDNQAPAGLPVERHPARRWHVTRLAVVHPPA